MINWFVDWLIEKSINRLIDLLNEWFWTECWCNDPRTSSRKIYRGQHRTCRISQRFAFENLVCLYNSPLPLIYTLYWGKFVLSVYSSKCYIVLHKGCLGCIGGIKFTSLWLWCVFYPYPFPTISPMDHMSKSREYRKWSPTNWLIILDC